MLYWKLVIRRTISARSGPRVSESIKETLWVQLYLQFGSPFRDSAVVVRQFLEEQGCFCSSQSSKVAACVALAQSVQECLEVGSGQAQVFFQRYLKRSCIVTLNVRRCSQ